MKKLLLKCCCIKHLEDCLFQAKNCGLLVKLLCLADAQADQEVDEDDGDEEDEGDEEELRRHEPFVHLH